MSRTTLYQEDPAAGNPFRVSMLQEVQALIRQRGRQADRRRRRSFRPDFTSPEHLAASLAEYRRQLRQMLGWPLTEPAPPRPPRAELRTVAEDALGRISRIWIETLPGVRTYGLFFRPHQTGRLPLVIAQHGGLGTPELCSGFFGSANYNDMTRRVLRRGVAVFAPQLLLWNPERFGPKTERETIDRRLKQLGGSLAALELHRLERSLAYFARRRDLDPQRIGMIGLSYGGFYTLFAAALMPHLKVAVSSCFFNDRRRYDFPDWTWFDAAHRFLDAEVGALVCPRPLYVEVGQKDELFAVRHARPEARRLAQTYRQAGVPHHFVYREHPGGHELDQADDGIDFLCRHLSAT